MPKRSSPLAAGCAFAFIALVALGILGVIGFFTVGGLAEVHKQSALMARARPVDATVIASEVRRETFGSSTSTGAQHTSTTHIVHVPVVTYSYQFQGTPHQSDDIYTFPRNGSEAWAQRIADGYPPGSPVTAYVDPAHPERAFLVRGWVPDPYYLVYTGAGCFTILISMGVLATFFLPRLSKRIAIIGAPVGFIFIAYAAAHYWMHAGFTSSTPDWIALGALATPALPFLALLLAKGWRRKFIGNNRSSAVSMGSSSKA
ncbi:MAG: DUF3592 domain-containing protein [Leptolyngbya sp. PLA3]|nr:MAG: DUF3592 domain-containing protein [Cyanobacteria bacterium CYA]MCE7969793.1 DUF3592 domain-containing protein [Leptolyngbya sp. PL-A3]